jgi:hypothetical protein
MNTHIWLSRILTGLLSLFQATTLRDRYYTLEQEHELYSVALDDIERINANSANPNALISNIVANLKSPRGGC